MTENNAARVLYTLAEAAQAVGVSERTLIRERNEHRLVFKRVRGVKRHFITADELRRWADGLDEVES